MVWTLYIYKHLKFSSIFRIWTITMPQRDCKNWTCNHQTGCLCNYCWATCHLVGKYLLVLNIFIQTSLDWMQLCHHPSQQQGQITSLINSPLHQPSKQPHALRLGKEDRTHDPEQGMVHMSKRFDYLYSFS